VQVLGVHGIGHLNLGANGGDTPIIHIVQSGEMLSRIAYQYFGSSAQEYIDLIVTANRVNPDEIRIGDELIIPLRNSSFLDEQAQIPEIQTTSEPPTNQSSTPVPTPTESTPTPTQPPSSQYITIRGTRFNTLSTSIDLSDLSGLRNEEIIPLRYMTNLTELHIPQSSNISDLTPISGLVNLRVLYLVGNNISDLTPISGLTNLRELWLIENNIRDLTPLMPLTNLTRLYLGRNQITDLGPLRSMTNLRYLGLSGGNRYSDLTPLSSLANLRTLSIGSIYRIDDITPLKSLTNLRSLSVDTFSVNMEQRDELRNALPSTEVRNLTPGF